MSLFRLCLLAAVLAASAGCVSSPREAREVKSSLSASSKVDVDAITRDRYPTVDIALKVEILH